MVAFSETPSSGSPLSVPREEDRRDSPRLDLDRIVACFGSQTVVGTGDVSVGGARWVGPAPHLFSSPIELVFQLPGDPEALHLSGEVVAREEAGNGVVLRLRFVDPPLESERRIARFIDQLRSWEARF